MDDQYVKVDFANLDFVILLFIYIGGFDLCFGFFGCLIIRQKI